MESKNQKIALFAGGGAYGAFIVGWLYIVRPFYKILAGTSTGALIVILLALRKYDVLSELYLNIDNKDMKMDKVSKAKFVKLLFVAIYRTLRNKRGLSDMGTTLEKKVRENYSESEHNQLIADGIVIYITAQCISHRPRSVEYFKNTETDYETFVKAVVASASVPVYAEPVQLRDHEWHCDGGVGEGVPSRIAYEYPDADIHLFLNYTSKPTIESNVAKNVFTTAIAVIKVMFFNIQKDDLVPLRGRNVMTVQPPFALAKNALDFNPKKMRKWHRIGEEMGAEYLESTADE